MQVLYVMARNDLQSMNDGKAESHSGHASCAFYYKYVVPALKKKRNCPIVKWTKETKQGFGTQINLSANIDQIHVIYNILKDDYPCEIIHDPTYPYLIDWQIVEKKLYEDENFPKYFTRPEDTAFYVFGDNQDKKLKNIIGHLMLK